MKLSNKFGLQRFDEMEQLIFAEATFWFRFRWQAEIGGKTCEGDGRGTFVLRHEGPERKIIHEHLSRFPK